ncbi:hypothetical protein PXD04_10090 [Methanosphaera sp. ISO3-F5]|uniref:hypothetical protein n=1 Tax=Methanosphaera sp. ISO3-F5 TaxID=1452353 RepID=UPI002B261971|nr:hypothetical protein [Methanosphaera sp. ISO3-F5]WQH64039.1 hypothetical protein PXD04_10090 [Methanosphaera sp. ISO3-F5]
MDGVITEYLDNDTQAKLKDEIILELQSLPENTREVIASINVLNFALINAEKMYKIRKHQYEIDFNKLVLSTDYTEQYRTIKEREQHAKLELSKNKQELYKLESVVQVYKAELEGYCNMLKLLLIYEGEHE